MPQVHIDFGNGHTLDRTLNGNIAFWFVTPQGEAFDLVPGLVDAQTFLARCDEAAELFGRMSEAGTIDALRAMVVQEHANRLQFGTVYLARDPAAVNVDGEPSIVPLGPRSLADVSKVRIEHPIKDMLAGVATQIPPGAAAPAPLVPGTPVPPFAATPSPLVPTAPIPLVAPLGLPARSDVSKMAVEMPLKHSLDARRSAIYDASGLPVDTAYNMSVRFPAADRMLMRQPLAPPELLTSRVYLEILGVNIDDPYLGLAPYLLGGEPGRDGEGLDAH